MGSWVGSTPAAKYTMNGVFADTPSCWLSGAGDSAEPTVGTGSTPSGTDTTTPVSVLASAAS